MWLGFDVRMSVVRVLCVRVRKCLYTCKYYGPYTDARTDAEAHIGMLSLSQTLPPVRKSGREEGRWRAVGENLVYYVSQTIVPQYFIMIYHLPSIRTIRATCR